MADEVRKRREVADQANRCRGHMRHYNQPEGHTRDNWRGRYRYHDKFDSHGKFPFNARNRRSASPGLYRERRRRDRYRDTPRVDSYVPDNRRRGQRNATSQERDVGRSRPPYGSISTPSDSPAPEL